ncbi:MAG TPA: hypothetical protein VGE30_03585 [Candidatus Saccharimonadales bacterium]
MATNKPPKHGIFDVAKPGSGQLPASGNSRSVIVSNRPVIKDPMVSEPTKPEATPEAPSTKKIRIEPLHDTAEAPTPEPETAPEPTVVVDDKPVTVTPETTVADIAPNALEEPVAIPQPSEAREAEDELNRKRVARLQKMIDEEEYFLPIKTVEERRSRKVAIIGTITIILLAAAWYNIALDAGLLPNTYDLPHTSFFTVK